MSPAAQAARLTASALYHDERADEAENRDERAFREHLSEGAWSRARDLTHPWEARWGSMSRRFPNQADADAWVAGRRRPERFEVVNLSTPSTQSQQKAA